MEARVRICVAKIPAKGRSVRTRCVFLGGPAWYPHINLEMEYELARLEVAVVLPRIGCVLPLRIRTIKPGGSDA